MPVARAVLFLLVLSSLAVSMRALVDQPPALPWAVALLVALLAWVVVGALVPGLRMYGDVLRELPEARGKVALTFDDGPDPRSTPRVLDLLAERGARATFFILGARARAHPELVRRMVAEGHTVGMHSFDHDRGYAFLTPGAVAKDVEACRAAILDALGEEARASLDLLWFRPPVGQSSPRTFAGLRRVGVEMVGWSVRGRDGLRRTTAGEVVMRVGKALQSGAIVLLHDAWERPSAVEEEPPAGVRALAEILDLCSERGLEPVSLDELVEAASTNSR